MPKPKALDSLSRKNINDALIAGGFKGTTMPSFAMCVGKCEMDTHIYSCRFPGGVWGHVYITPLADQTYFADLGAENHTAPKFYALVKGL